MLIDLIERASGEMLKKTEERISDLRESIQYYNGRFGAGWEDIIIRFEWQDELNMIRQSAAFSDEVKLNVDRLV